MLIMQPVPAWLGSFGATRLRRGAAPRRAARDKLWELGGVSGRPLIYTPTSFVPCLPRFVPLSRGTGLRNNGTAISGEIDLERDRSVEYCPVAAAAAFAGPAGCFRCEEVSPRPVRTDGSRAHFLSANAAGKTS